MTPHASIPFLLQTVTIQKREKMVKFSKELEAQLVPEWKEAFVNYWQLKKHVKKIKHNKDSSNNSDNQSRGNRHLTGGPCDGSIFCPMRSAAKMIADKFRGSDHVVTEVIRVRSRTLSYGEEDEVYQTELTQFFNDDGQEVKSFFKALDEELNKVNQFYKNREREFVDRAELLNKQLETLQNLKKVLAERCRGNCSSEADDIDTGTQSSIEMGSFSSPSTSSQRPSSVRDSGFTENFADMNKNSMQASESEDVFRTLERSNGVSLMSSLTRAKSIKRGKSKMGMTVHNPAITRTTSAIAAFTSTLWEDTVNNKGNPRNVEASKDFVSRKKIQRAEKMIRGAFVELYKGLCLLKIYSTLNLIAFKKILKKFDKVANQQASPDYLKAVNKSHFVSSDKVIRLRDKVETIFTKQFASNDRKKAMKFLRPHQQRDSHMLTFFVGLLTGCFITLFILYAILMHAAGLFSSAVGTSNYIEVVYPVFSIFALFSLHLFMYGCNLFAWKWTRINANFIFEFSPKTALNYRDAFLICTISMMIAIGTMVIHVLLYAKGFSSYQVNAIPGILLLVYIALLLCPLDVFYRPTRFYFIHTIHKIVCSPFCKVLMFDFFMADQLTSQLPLFRHMESTACFFIAGSFRTHDYETCRSGRLYREIGYLISFLPYYWRAMQCVRRWFDESDVNHLANMGKYVSAMVAAGVRLTYARHGGNLWLIIVLITSGVATIYQLYWDLVKDWGFLNPSSRNPWLRDDLILKTKGIYYTSIAVNVILRVAWVETLIQFRVGPVRSHSLDFFIASLEVVRRGHWNFYRLENEHLNNVGKFRAVKIVPLPFREVDSDE